MYSGETSRRTRTGTAASPDGCSEDLSLPGQRPVLRTITCYCLSTIRYQLSRTRATKASGIRCTGISGIWPRQRLVVQCVKRKVRTGSPSRNEARRDVGCQPVDETTRRRVRIDGDRTRGWGAYERGIIGHIGCTCFGEYGHYTHAVRVRQVRARPRHGCARRPAGDATTHVCGVYGCVMAACL